jgi:hypothetical protein
MDGDADEIAATGRDRMVSDGGLLSCISCLFVVEVVVLCSVHWCLLYVLICILFTYYVLQTRNMDTNYAGEFFISSLFQSLN